MIRMMRKFIGVLLILVLAGSGLASQRVSGEKLEKSRKSRVLSKFDVFVDKDGDGVNDLVGKRGLIKSLIDIINKTEKHSSYRKNTEPKDTLKREYRGKVLRGRGEKKYWRKEHK